MIVSFEGVLVAKVDALSSLPEIAPPLFVYLDAKDLHITLLSSEIKSCRKEFKQVWKNKVNEGYLNQSCPFPNVTFGEPYVADNGTKRSWVVDINEQDAVRNWLCQVLTSLGFGRIDISHRKFHVSLANRTGSKFDSVPDPWNCRVES